MPIINTKTLKNRNELKRLFSANSHLREEYFAALIESMLNKQDDQFYGYWQGGRTYRPGDVVIYESHFWEMIANEEICSEPDQPPSYPLWKPLNISLEDKEWQELKERVDTLETDFKEYQQTIEQKFKILEKQLQCLSDRLECYEQIKLIGPCWFFLWPFRYLKKLSKKKPELDPCE